MNELTPKMIVKELDRFIVGQSEAKKAVAVALRNRWRRQQLDSPLKEDILPKNILMIGPTGVGKTEIARRLATLTQAPFIKVEATKFTEIGYVGRDVEQIIRDLVEISIHNQIESVKKANYTRTRKHTEDKILNILFNEKSNELTREELREKMKNFELEEKEVDVFVKDNQSVTSDLPMFDLPGVPGTQMGMISLNDMLSKALGPKSKKKKMKIKDARWIIQKEESEKLIDQDKIVSAAVSAVEENGIVFIDEIDKVCSKNEHFGSSSISREGVQRDLLPLIEGCTVPTKRGPIKTDHILFITSGAFHVSKPSDLLPELQGRLPIRVELKALTKEDFVKILHEPESSLIKQYQALLETEEIKLTFTEDGIEEIAEVATQLNDSVENIGARRLHTLMEKVLEEISFNFEEYTDKLIEINRDFVTMQIRHLYQNPDLSKFIL